ncbi:hypothetical protein SAMN04515647_1617 [Cohaesibacter sp. ES.047]|uniref:hypothetical protein n=1 Tax=Cohaesibacter sp. ES.047 TaxID=1798205 RepID=UPI000BB99493|nr:hypothetical protein [Cohaesibacter sp. ES.047]SNY91395.1 hypothetical protein SAMN04515647_1617 [Cohaesibacter sp. ES.047]
MATKAKDPGKKTYIVQQRGPVLDDQIKEKGSEIEAHPNQVTFLLLNGTLTEKPSVADKAKATAKTAEK